MGSSRCGATLVCAFYRNVMKLLVAGSNLYERAQQENSGVRPGLYESVTYMIPFLRYNWLPRCQRLLCVSIVCGWFSAFYDYASFGVQKYRP